MTDGFPFPDWFPWLETWPSWMPNAPRNDGLGPPVPQRNLPAWPPLVGSRGRMVELLGNLGAPRDSGGGGLLGNLGAPRGSGNGGLLGHLSAPPAGPPLFDRGLDIEGVGPWGWPRLPIPSGLSPTVSAAPLPPPTSSFDSWKQDEFNFVGSRPLQLGGDAKWRATGGAPERQRCRLGGDADRRTTGGAQAANRLVVATVGLSGWHKRWNFCRTRAAECSADGNSVLRRCGVGEMGFARAAGVIATAAHLSARTSRHVERLFPVADAFRHERGISCNTRAAG